MAQKWNPTLQKFTLIPDSSGTTGVTTTSLFVTDLIDDSGELQKVQQTLTFEDGLLTNITATGYIYEDNLGDTYIDDLGNSYIDNTTDLTIGVLPTRDSLGLDTDDTVTFANLSGTNSGDEDLTGLVTLDQTTAQTMVGSPLMSYVEKTATYTITASDYTINCTANTFTVTLPTAVGITGRVYNIKNSGTGEITVEGDGTETIEGELTQTLLASSNMQVQSTGSNWIIT